MPNLQWVTMTQLWLMRLAQLWTKPQLLPVQFRMTLHTSSPSLFHQDLPTPECLLRWLIIRCRRRLENSNLDLSRRNAYLERIAILQGPQGALENPLFRASAMRNMAEMADLSDDENPPSYCGNEPVSLGGAQRAHNFFMMLRGQTSGSRHVDAVADALMRGETYGDEGSDEDMEAASQVRRRYCECTQDQVSDPDLWAHLYYAECSDEERYVLPSFKTSNVESDLPKQTVYSAMTNYVVWRGILLFLFFMQVSSSCDAGHCSATSAALLQRKREGQPNRIIMRSDLESETQPTQLSFAFEDSLYGSTKTLTGKFSISYDPAMYQGTSSEIVDVQEKSKQAFKQAIAFLLGDGIQDDDIVLRFEPIVALIQAKQAGIAEALVFFTFPVPSGDEATMVKEIQPKLICASLKNSLSNFGVPDTVEVTSAVTVEHIQSPSSSTTSPHPPSPSSTSPSSSTTSPSPSTTTTPSAGHVMTDITGKFTLTYDASVYTQGTAAEIADLQDKSKKAFEQSLAALLGHGVKGDLLVYVPGAIDVATMVKVVEEIQPDVLSASFKTSLSEFGVPDTVEVISLVTVEDIQSPSSSTTSPHPPSPSTTASPCGGGTSPASTIEGSFLLSYDLVNLNATAEELEQLKATGTAAIQNGLALLIGHSVMGQEIQVHYRPVETQAAFLQTKHSKQSPQSNLSIAVKIVFTFPCPQDITPELLSQAVAQITEAQLTTAMDDVFITAGIDANVLNLKVSIITSTWFYGTPTTTTTTTTTSTTTTMPFTIEDVHPCASFDDFMPQAKMSEYGWCEYDAGTANVSEMACLDAGCQSYDAGEGPPYCYCDTEVKCATLGLTWMYHTCEREMSAYMHGEYPALIESARNQGTCSGLETTWHQNIEQVLEWPARMCCKSWPKKLCDVNAELVTPCKEALPSCNLHLEHTETIPFLSARHNVSTLTDPADFMPDKIADEGSNITCKETLMSWWDEYTLLVNASKTGCDGVQTSWGEPLVDWIVHPAKQCCRSKPATICEPDLKPMTPCKDESDFQPEKILSMWCELSAQIPAADCGAFGCASHGDYCYCETATSCEAAGGKWMTTTCRDDFLGSQDRVLIKALNAAANGTNCNDLDVHGASLTDSISWSAQTCCSSWPASICKKDAKRMTPCKSTSDFNADKVMWAYCDFYSNGATMPNASTCQAQDGCRGDEHWCDCSDQSSCEAVGGTWHSQTCLKEIDQWSPEHHEALQAAEADGTCSGHLLHGHTKLEDLTQWPAQTCCSSYPQTVCFPDVEKMTPCTHKTDFLETKTVHSWCDLYPAPSEAVCVAQNCTYHNEWYCECSTEASCVGAGGRFHSSNCTSETSWWSPEVHKALKEAQDKGTCADVQAGWGSLEQVISWPGGFCCDSGKTMCEDFAARLPRLCQSCLKKRQCCAARPASHEFLRDVSTAGNSTVEVCVSLQSRAKMLHDVIWCSMFRSGA
eukprot:s1155_g13.t1